MRRWCIICAPCCSWRPNNALKQSGAYGYATSIVQHDRPYGTALGIVCQQNARSFELRSTTSLARLWRGQHRRREAYDLLALIYGKFTEGFDTPDLRRAKALLDELH